MKRGCKIQIFNKNINSKEKPLENSKIKGNLKKNQIRKSYIVTY